MSKATFNSVSLLSGQAAVPLIQSHSARKKNASIACFFLFLKQCVSVRLCSGPAQQCQAQVLPSLQSVLRKRKDGNVAWRGRRRRQDGAESEKLALIVLASHSQPPAHAARTARIARRHLTDEVGS